MARKVITAPPGGRRLAPALEIANDANTLKALARLVGVRGVTRKAEMAAALADVMLVRGPVALQLKTLWARLDPLQKAAIAETLYDPEGRFSLERFRAKYGQQPSWGDTTGWKPEPSLLCLFLVPMGDGAFIPDDLAERLRQFVPEPRTEQLATLDEPITTGATEAVEAPLRFHDARRVAPQELFALLRLVDQGKVRVSDKTKRPSAKGITEVNKILVGGDHYGADDEPTLYSRGEVGAIRAFAWPLLVQAGRLAKVSGTRLELTASGRKALTQPAHDTLCRLWRKWVGTTLLDEFSRVDLIKGQKGRKRLTAVAERRAVVARALGDCPPGRWVAVDEFFRHTLAAGHKFYVAHEPWRLYVTHQQYGSLDFVGTHGWTIIEGRYALAVIFEYAATLGLVDIAYTVPSYARKDYRRLWGTDEMAFLSRYDGLACFRVTDLGAFALGLTDTYEPSAGELKKSLRVLPDLDVVAESGQFESADESLLTAYCTRCSAAVFTLDRATALAAVEKGHRAEELVSFLEQASSAELPDTVRAFLDDLVLRGNMLRCVGHALVVECTDPAVALHLAHDARIRKLCFQAGKNMLVVPAENEVAFRRCVLELGYPLTFLDGKAGKLR